MESQQTMLTEAGSLMEIVIIFRAAGMHYILLKQDAYSAFLVQVSRMRSMQVYVMDAVHLYAPLDIQHKFQPTKLDPTLYSRFFDDNPRCTKVDKAILRGMLVR